MFNAYVAFKFDITTFLFTFLKDVVILKSIMNPAKFYKVCLDINLISLAIPKSLNIVYETAGCNP